MASFRLWQRSSTTMAVRVFRFLPRSPSPSDLCPGTEHLSFARAHTCTVYCTLVWVCVVNATEGRTFYGFYRGIKRSNRSKLSSSARSLACTIQVCVRILSTYIVHSVGQGINRIGDSWNSSIRRWNIVERATKDGPLSCAIRKWIYSIRQNSVSIFVKFSSSLLEYYSKEYS